jgi:hypothetical protein
MSRVLPRLFLLLLFGCDWAGDPYFGCSPLSCSFANQVVVCHTIRAGVKTHASALADALPAISSDAVIASAPMFDWVTPSDVTDPLPRSRTPLVYVLKTLLL